MQRFVGTGLDIPVVTDRIEVALVDIAGLDRLHRVEDPVDAEQLGDGGVLPQCERLRQVADLAHGVDLPGSRLQVTGDEPEQGGLAGAVAADQPGSTGSEGAVDTGERDGAVGPLEGQIAQRDGGLRRHRQCFSLLSPVNQRA